MVENIPDIRSRPITACICLEQGEKPYNLNYVQSDWNIEAQCLSEEDRGKCEPWSIGPELILNVSTPAG